MDKEALMNITEKLRENQKVIEALANWFKSQGIGTKDATLILCQMLGSMIAFHSDDEDRLERGIELNQIMLAGFARFQHERR